MLLRTLLGELTALLRWILGKGCLAKRTQEGGKGVGGKEKEKRWEGRGMGSEEEGEENVLPQIFLKLSSVDFHKCSRQQCNSKTIKH